MGGEGLVGGMGCGWGRDRWVVKGRVGHGAWWVGTGGGEG